MATTFWLWLGYNFSCMIASDTLFDSSRDQGCKGRCHGNQYWDCMSCKRILTGDNDMGISYKGLFILSQPCV